MAVQPTSQNIELQAVSASKMPNNNKCHYAGCTKSLKLVDALLKCRCEGIFCKKHRDVVAHKCPMQSPLSASTRKATQVYESASREGSAF
jgi:hypothetical protein